MSIFLIHLKVAFTLGRHITYQMRRPCDGVSFTRSRLTKCKGSTRIPETIVDCILSRADHYGKTYLGVKNLIDKRDDFERGQSHLDQSG